MSGERIGRALDVLNEGIERGWHLGAQVYVSHRGEVVADLGLGEARRGVPMEKNSLLLWFSATKPVVVAALARLWERGRIDLDDRVSAHIPEFGGRGKEEICVRHVLTHTGGFRSGVDLNWKPEAWEGVVARICNSGLERGWVPGSRAGYHAVSGWYILGELVRRIDGRPLEEILREEILKPLGMVDSWVGMPSEQYRAYGDRVSVMHNTATREPHHMDEEMREQVATVCNPGAGGHGPVRELGLFYEMLLGKGKWDGVQLLSPQTVEALVSRHRVGLYDQTFKHVVDWGLGFLVDSNLYGAETVPYGYGPYASPRTFGHSSRQSSMAFADPEHELVVVAGVNGMPGERTHDERMRAFTAALYRDLGLAN